MKFKFGNTVNRKILRHIRISEEREKFVVTIGIFAVAVIFTLYPWTDENKYSFFPFFHGSDGWDGKMTKENWCYGACGHVAWQLGFRLMTLETGKKIYHVCFVLETIAIIDYVLRYNFTWFSIGGFDIEYNIIEFIIILYFAHKQYGNTD